MNPLESLRPITRRSLPDYYASPGVCHLAEPTSSGSGASVASELDFVAIVQREGPASMSFVLGVDGNDAILTWPEVSYAYSYIIYRATAPGGPFLVIAANVLVETYVDADLAPGDYYYKVTALEPNFGETTASPVVGPVTV